MKDKDKLAEAFTHLVEEINLKLHETEQLMKPAVEEIIKNARQITRDLYEMSEEDAEALVDTLKKDIAKAQEVMQEQKQELGDWFEFDASLMEDRFLDMVRKAADSGWLAYRDFYNEDHQGSHYHSGTIAHAGRFSCTNCSQEITLTHSSRIPPCPSCQNGDFYRIPIAFED